MDNCLSSSVRLHAREDLPDWMDPVMTIRWVPVMFFSLERVCWDKKGSVFGKGQCGGICFI